MTSATGPYEEAYAYSRMGNILTRTVETEARTYIYGERPALTPGAGDAAAALPPAGDGSSRYPSAFAPTTGQPFAVQALSDGSRLPTMPTGI